ncbi:DUF2255 family protein [Paractinoplanes ferrugineus]|uniref:DUF2255 family protein n=1 Tax=Paractinoplanes ferrugineus TaxID=113564 RepID=A0A919MGB1_9ACTN|nr:DUF2255 family protein [Actinoplanes ferrugineus]GIE13669.1 hypothetical protein Afe05nite_55090 [Actinoplanes ferrugineus]
MLTWPADALDRIDAAHELRIAVERTDGSRPDPVPIWVVRVADQVYVRTWYRRGTGWFGRAVAAGRAHIEVPGLDAAVTVEDLGAGPERADVDAAYQAKYGHAGAASMVTDAAAGTTLRLSPA